MAASQDENRLLWFSKFDLDPICNGYINHVPNDVTDERIWSIIEENDGLLVAKSGPFFAIDDGFIGFVVSTKPAQSHKTEFIYNDVMMPSRALS
ncbi:MAG: hypothetical protein DDT34_01153 [Firmicutes bacterium]|nr:hypothetical protein [Bacillota bacterium]MBT9165639.1 hypothetical protein [Chloroflexota bacterium]